MEYVLLILLILLIICIYWIYSNSFKIFKYENLYRRYCKICGQQQDSYINVVTGKISWENMKYVNDANCKCQKHKRK